MKKSNVKWEELSTVGKIRATVVLIAGLGGMAFVMFMFFYLTFTPHGKVSIDEANPVPKELITVKNSSFDGSVQQVKRFMKEALNDPDSVQYIEWSAVQNVGYKEFQVYVKFRAKNGFGGYVVNTWKVRLDSSGEVNGYQEVSDPFR